MLVVEGLDARYDRRGRFLIFDFPTEQSHRLKEGKIRLFPKASAFT